MTQKETLWTQVYIEALKKHDRPLLERDIEKVESAATKAVEAFEKRFEKYKLPDIDVDSIKYMTDDLNVAHIITEFPTEYDVFLNALAALVDVDVSDENIIDVKINDKVISYGFDEAKILQSISI